MSVYEWEVNELDINNEEILKYCEKWELPYNAVRILYSRNYRDFEDVNKFMNPEICCISPFEFKNMQKSVEILKKSIENHEKICIYGDYDADGVTATALIFNYLKNYTQNIMYYIPDREIEGYGLNTNSINKLHSLNVNLIITVDNGISAHNEIKYAYELGMKVIVTDHHKIPEILPKCEAIIDPWLEKSLNNNWDMKFHNFAGVGVAYKFIQAFELLNNKNINLYDYLDLVALGSIGDSMELFGETRYLVKRGLSKISNSKNTGVKNLVINNFNLKEDYEKININSIDVAFKLVPKINSSGRIESSETALKLFISDNNQECSEICRKLQVFNNNRKEIELKIIIDIMNEIRKNPSIIYQKVIILAGDNWHPGVIGIVASRILEYYGKPCILISRSFNNSVLARGSCRSIEGFSIYNLISSCAEYLESFGGHTLAAGMSLKPENIDKFRDKILKNLENIDINNLKLNIDLELKIPEISVELLDEIGFLEPFGNGNPEPVFVIRKLKLHKIIPIGQGNHMKLVFFDGENFLDTLYFNKKVSEFLYDTNEILDIVVSLNKNIYQNNISVSVYVIDMKISDINTKEIIKQRKIYEKFMRNESLNSEEIKILLPNREEFAKIYRYLSSDYIKINRADIVSFRVFKSADFCGKISIILDVLREMNLIDVFYREKNEFEATLKNFQKKVELCKSEILKKLGNFNG